MKRIAFIAALAVAVLAAVWFFSRPKPVAVALVTAERGPVAATVSNTRAGTVDACRRAGLSPALGGQIARLPVKDGDRVEAGDLLLERWNAQAILVTRGERGMTLVQPQGRVHHFPASARQVYDVTGAGDTVAATCALALAAGASFEASAMLANAAAGIVVTKVGTATVTAAELRRSAEG